MLIGTYVMMLYCIDLMNAGRLLQSSHQLSSAISYLWFFVLYVLFSSLLFSFQHIVFLLTMNQRLVVEQGMWDELPWGLLSHIFSFLSPQSLACAISTCSHWRLCVAAGGPSSALCHQPPWFIAMSTRSTGSDYCYARNPETGRWHLLPLDFVPHQIRLVASAGNLLLCKLAGGTCSIHLLLCNPFTRQFRLLPELNTPRSNPAVGVVHLKEEDKGSFRIYVAGGTSTSRLGSSCYKPTVEMYDPADGGCWTSAGEMPVEFAVRLTVWTPNESVYAGGVVYWMTSARAYSVMGFDVVTGSWREVKAPMAERLEWAALVQRRSGRLGLVGGRKCSSSGTGEGWIWELGGSDEWAVMGRVPPELMMTMGGEENVGRKRKKSGRLSLGSGTKCAGSDGVVYVFKDLSSEMLMCREECHHRSHCESGIDDSSESCWEWVSEEGGGGGGGGEGSSSTTASMVFPIRGVMLQPTLSPSQILCS